MTSWEVIIAPATTIIICREGKYTGNHAALHESARHTAISSGWMNNQIFTVSLALQWGGLRSEELGDSAWAVPAASSGFLGGAALLLLCVVLPWKEYSHLRNICRGVAAVCGRSWGAGPVVKHTQWFEWGWSWGAGLEHQAHPVAAAGCACKLLSWVALSYSWYSTYMYCVGIHIRESWYI